MTYHPPPPPPIPNKKACDMTTQTRSTKIMFERMLILWRVVIGKPIELSVAPRLYTVWFSLWQKSKLFYCFINNAFIHESLFIQLNVVRSEIISWPKGSARNEFFKLLFYYCRGDNNWTTPLPFFLLISLLSLFSIPLLIYLISSSLLILSLLSPSFLSLYFFLWLSLYFIQSKKNNVSCKTHFRHMKFI